MKELQYLCLSTILQNFDRYHLTYSTTEDRCLKLKFEFLQRVYSAEIIAMFDEEFNYQVEYFDFVFNKYLKRLQTLWIEDRPWNVISEKIAEIGPNLEEITFEDGNFPWDSLFIHLPNLKRVIFTDYCNDKSLLRISIFCPNIEYINIENSSGVSDDGLKQLCRRNNGISACSVLKELLIEETSVTDNGVKYLLKNLPSLEKLYHRNLPEILYSIHKADISDLHKINPYNITHLNLMFMKPGQIFDDLLKICVVLCPRLNTLSSPAFKQEHLVLLSRFYMLENMYLDCYKELSLPFYQFLKRIGNSLTSLKISDLTSASFSAFYSGYPRFDASLQMDKFAFQHTVDDSMPPVFHKLKTIAFDDLNLIDPVINRTVICVLSSSPNLDMLCFRGCDSISLEIKTLILRNCAQCKLSLIDFSGSDVGVKFLQDILLTCSTLKSLLLHMCEITDDVVAMTQLEQLATSLPFVTRLHYRNTSDDRHIFIPDILLM